MSNKIGNKIADKITEVSKSSPQNNLKTAESKKTKKYQKRDIYHQKKE